MAQPLPYERDFDFQNFQSGQPSTPLPGDKVNAEFDQIAATLDEVLARIALLQDDDTALKRGSVGPDQLADSLALGFEPPSAWTTATAYVDKDTVFEDGGFYKCLISHTSGTFATDLAAEKWELIADFTSATAAAEAAQAAAEAAQAAAASSASAASTSAGTATTKAAEAAASAATATSKAAEAAGSAGDASASSGTAQAAAVTATTKAEEASDSAAAAAASAASIVIGPGGVQAYSANLAGVAAVSPTDGNFIVGNGTTFTAENGATARTSLGLGSAAVANLLDEDNMASDSDTAVPSQQSVNVGKLQKVATRTALKALSTSVHSAVYLFEAGREGVFVFRAGDYSAQVTVDTCEGVYIAPASDSDGSSGAWVRQMNGGIDPRWFGAIDGTSNDSTAALQCAFAVAALGTKAVYIPAGTFKTTARIATLTGSHWSVTGEHGASFLYTEDNIDILRIDRSTSTYYGAIVGVGFIGNVSGTRTSCEAIRIVGSAANWMSFWTFASLTFLGVYRGIRVNITTNASGDELGFDWNSFINIKSANYEAYNCNDAIYFDKGSGTGNIYSGGNLVFANSGIAFAGAAGANIGDISIFGIQMGGGGTGIVLGASAAYRSNVTIVGCQFDAGIGVSVWADGYTNLKIEGNNWGGATELVLLNCAYVTGDGPGSMASRYGVQHDTVYPTVIDNIATFELPTWSGATVVVNTHGLIQGSGLVSTQTQYFFGNNGGTVTAYQIATNTYANGTGGTLAHSTTVSGGVITLKATHNGNAGTTSLRHHIEVINGDGITYTAL